MVRDYHRSAAENVGIGADAGDAAVTDRTSRAVAPVSAICAAFAAQPSVYQPEARRPDVAPLYGSVGRKHRNRTRWPREKPLAANAGTRRNGQNREILDAAARKQPAMDLSRDKNAEKDELVAVGNGRGNAGSRSVSRRIWVRSFYAAVGRTGS